MRNKIIVGVISIILLFIVLNSLFKTDKEVIKEDTIETEELAISEPSNSKVKVDIKGAIKKPGVYEIESNKRVQDVISIAGGLNKDANTNYINLSAKVTDEMVIWIYTNKEIKELELDKSSTKYMITECNCPVVDNTTCLNSNTSNTGKININKASLEQLMTLEGIGESKAKSIIEYRTSNGNFKVIEDIKNVNGIGESAFDKIKNNITV